MINPEIKKRAESIKAKIEKLIGDGCLDEAKAALERFEEMLPGDLDACSMRAVIHIIEGDLNKAEVVLLDGLKRDSVHFDLLYNLAYIYELRGQLQQAADLYNKAASAIISGEQKQNATQSIDRLKAMDKNIVVQEKPKIVFFVKEGMDSFLGDIIEGLDKEYWVRKMIVQDLNQIDAGMKWADICWFEWCDELVAYGSKLPIALYKKIICRLHRYEAFSDYIKNVVWENVDKVIFVSKHIKNTVIKKVNLPESKCIVVLNGINNDKFDCQKRSKGYNLAWIGYLNLRKNPVLVLQYLYELVKKDKRYKLHIAGSFQDESLQQYMEDIIDRLCLNDNVIQYGYIPNDRMTEWLKDKNYIVTGSIAEGHPVGVMEAMSCGLKPVIHYFPGAEAFYPKSFIYYNLDDFIRIITDTEYDSNSYHCYITENYSMEKQLNEIKNIIGDILSYKKVIAKVISIINGDEKPQELLIDNLTVLIPSYNRVKMLAEDIENGLKLGRQRKLIIDDCSTEQKEWLLQIKQKSKEYNVDLIQKELNEGLAEARRTGFQNITTEFAAILDDDDMLLCVDRDQVKNEIEGLNSDYVLVVPRYSINVSDDKIEVGYDRLCYDGWCASDVLKDIAAKSEIKLLFSGGLIGRTDELKKVSSIKRFRVAEDFVVLSRLLAANGDKKVKVSESLIHVRRLTKDSLIRNLTDVKLILGLFAQSIACYYCLVKGLAEKDDVLIWMNKRASLIQKLYHFGESFENELINYLKSEISEEVFISYLGLYGLALECGLAELAPELPKMQEIFSKENKKRALPANIKELPLVSLIIPTFNRKSMLKRAIDHVLKQDYPNIEVIISDNCSDDGTENMVKDDYKNEYRVIYSRNETNIGPALNYKKAFYELAKGKYCVMQSDDDYFVDSSYISRAVKVLNENDDISFVFSGYYHNHERLGEKFRIKPNYPAKIDGLDFFIRFLKERYPNMPNLCTTLIRVEDAKKANILYCDPHCMAADLSILLRLLLVGNAGYIDNVTLVYTLHKGSASINTDTCVIDSNDDFIEKAIQTVIADINEMKIIKTVAQKLGRFTVLELDDWLQYRVFRYLYWKLCESVRTEQECRALLHFIKQEYPGLLESLKTTAINRFSDCVLDGLS